MCRQMNSYFVEGDSLSRPPFFDGSNYTYWKQRMKAFLGSTDYQLWLVFVNGPHIPKKTENGEKVVKHTNEWNEQDIKNVQLNYRAMSMMFCAVKPEEYMKLSTCSSAKEVWDKLQIVYEGTDKVRQMRSQMLLREYELFKMRKFECIEDMFKRLSHIINDLHALGIKYSNEELVQKVLRILSRPWHDKVAAIQKARNLNQLTYDELRAELNYFLKEED